MKLQVADQNDAPVANAQVSGNWDVEGTTKLALCITDASGSCEVTLTKLSSETVTFTVIDITADGYLYDAGSNAITEILIDKP